MDIKKTHFILTILKRLYQTSPLSVLSVFFDNDRSRIVSKEGQSILADPVKKREVLEFYKHSDL